MRYASVVLFAFLVIGCGGRHPASPEEQALGGSIVSSSQALSGSHAQGTLVLPYGTAVLVAPLLGADCVAGQEAVDGTERLHLACNHLATEIRGDFVRAGDHYTIDVHGDGMFDLDFTADLTLRPDFLDGTVSLSVERSLILSKIALSTDLELHGLTRDASGCVTSGSVVASLKAEIPGEDLDYAIDALYGPGCGTMMVAD